MVTGAAGGIGQALARRFAREGMRLALGDVNAEELERVCGDLDALRLPCDVTRAEAVEAFADAVFQRFGSVHLLCNNAGVYPSLLSAWRQPVEDWRWVMEVNLYGLVHGIRAFVPRMIGQGEASVVMNTVSLAGLITKPHAAPYYASKHAAMAVSECLDQELREMEAPVRVVTLNPGWVRTRLLEARREGPEATVESEGREADREAAVRKMVAEGLTPEQVAEAAWQGILERRFYIYPESGRLGDVSARFERILRGGQDVEH